MPLYEYECEVCGRRFERIQKFSDPPIEVCPTCGGHVHKLVSSPAFQFKGTGWYVTDYSRKEKTATAEGEGQPAAKDAKENKEREKDPKGSKETKESKGPSESPAKDSPPAASPPATPSKS